MSSTPQRHVDLGECVEAVISRLGRRIVLGLPLGIGKPNLVANEFFRRAARDPGLDLTIITALSLMRPASADPLAKRLVDPLVERVFGDYPDPEYALAAKRGALPPNVRVIEFFLEPGAWLRVDSQQRDFLSANYTHVAREFLARGANVIAQLVAKRQVDGRVEYSLGSNPDVTVDLLPLVEEKRAAGRDIVMLGAVHPRMPFMFGAAQWPAERFDYLLEDPRHDYELYCPPNAPLRATDHAIALRVSSLVRDGGTLQIGIGELGDALVYALLLRHQNNGVWRHALLALGETPSEDPALSGPFADGLYACTEMLVDQMLDLMQAGILRRHVYPSVPLMRLLSSGRITERFDASILGLLAEAGAGPRLDGSEFAELKHCGVFRADAEFRDGRIRVAGERWIEADLADPACRTALAAQALGRELQRGLVAHAAFFMGPRGFYAKLREMPERELRRIDMCGVGFVNQIEGDDHELRVLARRHARFVNTTMMITLLGGAVSDTLADGRVVSGVGGQYNFVAMAHALPGGRSILCVRATRTKDGEVGSNLVWNYPHTTIPRHLRDIVVSEYGIADLRGATDGECVERLLAITDARFQEPLVQAAKAAGKLARDFALGERHRRNEPQRVSGALAQDGLAGLFSEYPFGSDLSPEEIELSAALRWLSEATAKPLGRLRALVRAMTVRIDDRMMPALQRMKLDRPATLRDRLSRRLVALALENA